MGPTDPSFRTIYSRAGVMLHTGKQHLAEAQRPGVVRLYRQDG